MPKRKTTPTRFIAGARLLRKYGVSLRKPLPLSLAERYASLGPKTIAYLIELGLVFRDPPPPLAELPSKTASVLLTCTGLSTKKEVLRALRTNNLHWNDHAQIRGTYYRAKRLQQLGALQYRDICTWTGFVPSNQLPPFP